MNELAVREYLGNRIEFKMVDGYVYANANQMANGFGGSQKLKDWKRSENTKRYIEALESKGKFSTPLIDTKIGGINGGETWIHEKLVLNFARYLNVEFEFWCDEQIATLLREGSVSINKKQNLLLSIIQSSTEVERAVALNKYELEYVKPLEQKTKEQEEYIEHVVHNEKYYITPTVIGNKFGMSAMKLNNVLQELGIQYKQGKKWCLKADYYGIGDYSYFQKPNGVWEKGSALKYSNDGERVIFKALIANGYNPI
jgi:DNA-dependent RNA polymerase auxiliary subunit epsilon